MDAKIMQEVVAVIEDLNAKIDKIGKLESVDTYFDLPDLNVIWELVAGIRCGKSNLNRLQNAGFRYEYDDQSAHKQFDYLRAFLQESTAGPMTATPWLKKVISFEQIEVKAISFRFPRSKAFIGTSGR